MSLTKNGVPGVYLSTEDLSLRISPENALSVGAILRSAEGPVNEVTTVTSADQLKYLFGKPTNDNYEEWLMIARIFKYKVGQIGATLRVVRTTGAGSKNGVMSVGDSGVIADPSDLLINNVSEVEDTTVDFDGGLVKFATRYPTNVVYKVALATPTTFVTAEIVTGGAKFIDNFDVEPSGTEVALAILDADDNVLEKHIVDLTDGNKDGFNESTFIEDVINTKSHYLFAFRSSAAGVPASFTSTAITAGVYNIPTDVELANAIEYFKNTETVDIQYMLAHPNLINETMSLCELRQDCSFRAGVPISVIRNVNESVALANCINYSSTTLSRNTTYGSVGANAIYVNDPYNNKKRWINVAGDMIGLRIRQNLSAEPWYADAGLNYGQLIDVIKVDKNWSTSSQRDLIKNKFNPIIDKRGLGVIKWQQINYTKIPSALRDETTRELCLYIYRAAKEFLQWKLFEINDRFTRAQIQSQMSRFLSGVQAGRGIRLKDDGGDGYFVRCDETNNTSDVINQNMLVIEVSFLPSRILNEIHLKLNILDSEVQLEFLSE